MAKRLKLVPQHKEKKDHVFGSWYELATITATELEFNNEKIELVKKCTYLGVMLDAMFHFTNMGINSGIISSPKLKSLGEIKKSINRGTALYL